MIWHIQSGMVSVCSVTPVSESLYLSSVQLEEESVWNRESHVKSEPEKDYASNRQWRQEDCWDFKATLNCVSKTNNCKNQALPGTRSYSVVGCTF